MVAGAIGAGVMVATACATSVGLTWLSFAEDGEAGARRLDRGLSLAGPVMLFWFR
jgi:hypothetical protein